MSKWEDFLKEKNFGFEENTENVNEIFGLFGRSLNQRKKGKFADAYMVLLKKHGGDEEKANKEFDAMVASPAGQYQLMKLTTETLPTDKGHEEDAKYNQFKARSTSGPDMFKQ